MVSEGCQERACQRRVPKDSQVSANEGSDQPAPNSSLVVGAVALLRSTTIVTAILRTVGRKAAETKRSQQVACADSHDGALLVWREGARRQRDSQDLIGP